MQKAEQWSDPLGGCEEGKSGEYVYAGGVAIAPRRTGKGRSGASKRRKMDVIGRLA